MMEHRPFGRQNRRKRIPASVWLILMVYYLVFAGGILYTASEANADPAPAAAAPRKVINNTWYELSEDGTVLTLRLADYRRGYQWKLGKSNETTLITTDWGYDGQENRLIRLEALPEGEKDVVLTMSCLSDTHAPAREKKTLEVHVEPDLRLSILRAEE